jgi:hypothetical protein
MLRVTLVTVLVLVLAPAAAGAVVPYPSSKTIFASGPLPPTSAARVVRLNVARGETEHAQIVVTGAARVSARLEGAALGPITTRLLWAHYVRAGGRDVPDALMPWNGALRRAEESNQPVWLEVTVPPETPPGAYDASVEIDAAGRTTTVPVRIRVFDVSLPSYRSRTRSLVASFLVSSQSYVSKRSQLYGISGKEQGVAASESFYRFLSEHRISPASYGFGEPTTSAGYVRSSRWWLDSASRMEGLLTAAGGAFPAMRIPISSNRTSPANYLAGLSPYQPETWCGYLGAVHRFWQSHGWTAATTPFLFAFDEPREAQHSLIARQAAAAHRCFPGARPALTANPLLTNRVLWDGRGSDDVDIWVTLARRWYGTFTGPGGQHRSERRLFRLISQAQSRGKTVWAYTYTGTPGSPGFAATERLSNAHMFILWSALERTPGIFYTDGVTSYDRSNPLQSLRHEGQHVLVYPGLGEPIASARLEQIRDGIEDWSLLELVRRQYGEGRVRQLLGTHGLFSADASHVKLACTLGCELQGSTKYSWPRWSHDASTPRRIEQAKLEALQLVSARP